MAQPTTSAPAKPKRKGGARVAKPKTAYVLLKGEFDPNSVKVALNAEQAMEVMDGDPTLRRIKVVFPVARRAKPEGDQAQAA